MARKRQGTSATDSNLAQKPRALTIAGKGIKTSSDFARLMSDLMSDLLEARVPPQIGNAVCNAGGKLLKVVEMQQKYGSTAPDGSSRRELTLVIEESKLTSSQSAAISAPLAKPA